MVVETTGMEAVKGNVKNLAQLARDLGITRGAIAQWDDVPANRVGDVSRLTGLKPEVVRPDIFAPSDKDA